jgi:hypothetical protein
LELTDFDLEQFFGMQDDSNPIMMLIWILPIIIFIFYGQRIQLWVTSGEIKKAIKKLDSYSVYSKDELLKFVKNNHNSKNNFSEKIDQFLDYFTIMPVEMDPNGIVDKVHHIVRSRDDYTRLHLQSIFPDVDSQTMSKIQTLLEISTSLRLIHKIINHMFLTAKKQNNYPLILPLQMMLPFIMEHAIAMKESIPVFIKGQPIGDSIGPMIVGKMMLNHKKEPIEFETVLCKKEFLKRNLFLVKAEGPNSTVGRPAESLSKIISENKISSIIMIDAALKMEGEKSGLVARGFGAAIGGIGTEKFQIESVAVKNNIPIFSLIIKQSVKEAITLMTKDIADQFDNVMQQLEEMILENCKEGDNVVIIGVGNTVGVPQ